MWITIISSGHFNSISVWVNLTSYHTAETNSSFSVLIMTAYFTQIPRIDLKKKNYKKNEIVVKNH